MKMHDKHRQRLDTKVARVGLDLLEVHEQLEHILFAVIPRGNTNHIAHNLLDKFGTISGVLNADVEELIKVEGVGRRVATFLTTLPALVGIVERCEKFEKVPKLDTLQEAAEYAKTFFRSNMQESAYLISLNSSFRVIAINKISEGVEGGVFIFPKQVIRQALANKATAVIVIHNHPGGKVNPSISDTKMCKKLFKGFEAVDILLFDAIIVSGEQFFSYSEKGYFDEDNKDKE